MPQLKEYIKAGKPGRDFKDNGDLKANVVPFVAETPHEVMPRFQARTFGRPTSCDRNIRQVNNKVIVEFTPKYHSVELFEVLMMSRSDWIGLLALTGMSMLRHSREQK
jgi:hypothetical protein